MRHRFRVLFLTFVCSFALAVPRAGAQGNTNNGEFSILFWSPAPELSLQSGDLEAATGISTIDFVREFAIDNKTFPEIRFSAGRGHKFRFGYVPVKYEADAVIQRTITFRGQTFNIGAPATTEIFWDVWRFGYEWDFVSLDRGYAGVVVELKYNTLDASIDSPALAQSAATEQKALIPTIGFAGRGYPHPMVAISGEFTGLKVKAGDFDASFYDFDINGTVTFGRYIGVQGGYRAVTVDYTQDDDVGDLKLKGPYIGAVVRF